MMVPDILLYDGYDDLMDWYDRIGGPSELPRHMRLLSIRHPELIVEHLNAPQPSLFATYALSYSVSTQESDERTHALSLLHEAGAVEVNA